MKDLLLSQVQRGLNGYSELCKILDIKACYDVVIAHETFCSGMAALYYADKVSKSALKILDIVEYPVYSQRSTSSLRQCGLSNPYSNSLTYDFAVNIANKFDFCYATSAGQIQSYVRNGCVKEIELMLNCRDESGLSVLESDILAKMYGFDKSDVLLVYPNRAYEYCGLEFALNALALLDDRFKLIVLGEVVEDISGKVQELVIKLGLQNRFFITGMLDPAMIIPIMLEADIALILLEPVLENHRYSLPNRLFDAVSTHTPIVAFDNTEVSEFVLNNNIGVVCKYSCPNTLSDSIRLSVERSMFYRYKLKNIGFEYTWSCQVKHLIAQIKDRRKDNAHILIVAMKDIRRNDRIRRIAKSLLEINCRVDIVTKFAPLSSMIIDGVNYHFTN